MPDTPAPSYGSSRERGAKLSHAQIERAALDILSTGTRPSVESLRKRLGRGSPATILHSLRRFWRDLGARAQGHPAALARLPTEIADLADAIWQRSLTLAAQAARHEDNAARERLAQIRLENELRAQSFGSREKEYESAAREREQALAASREHLLSTLRMLESDRLCLRAKEARIADLEAQIEAYRRQLATIVERVVIRHRPGTKRKRPPAKPVKPSARSTRRNAAKNQPRVRSRAKSR
jgi:tryptophan 2,3-dioxygenase